MFKRKKRHAFENRFSFSRFLSAPFHALFQLLSGSDSELGQHVPLPTRIWRQLVRIVIFPFWFAVQIFKFIVLSWTTTRDGNAVLWGIIPTILILAVLGVLFVSGFVEDRLTKSLHRQHVVDAENVEDYDSAVLFSRRVQNINQRDTWKFIHAVTLNRAGLEKNALSIFHEMADPETAGYLSAHLILAEELQKISEDDARYQDNLALARKHYEIVIDKASEGDVNYIKASKKLPMVMFRQGGEVHIAEAMDLFRNLSADMPQIVPSLAQYLIDHGEEIEAARHINRAMGTLKEYAERNPNIPDIWTMVYQIRMVRSEFKVVLNELSAGLRMVSDKALQGHILNLIANALVERSRIVTKVDTHDQFVIKLRYISRALTTYPRNVSAINDIVDLVVYPPNDSIPVWLEENSRDFVPPAIHHVIFGVRDSVNGKPATGSKHFRLAFNGDNRTAIVVNDIARDLCLRKERYEDALRLVDVAIDTWNTSAKLFQTRGEILMRLDRHEDAVVELEYAADQLSNDPGVFTSLADCYDALGRPDEAVELREKSEALRQEIYQKTKELRERLAAGN